MDLVFKVMISWKLFMDCGHVLFRVVDSVQTVTPVPACLTSSYTSIDRIMQKIAYFMLFQKMYTCGMF